MKKVTTELTEADVLADLKDLVFAALKYRTYDSQPDVMRSMALEMKKHVESFQLTKTDEKEEGAA
jgi:hypothetical protein